MHCLPRDAWLCHGIADVADDIVPLERLGQRAPKHCMRVAACTRGHAVLLESRVERLHLAWLKLGERCTADVRFDVHPYDAFVAHEGFLSNRRLCSDLKPVIEIRSDVHALWL